MTETPVGSTGDARALTAALAGLHGNHASAGARRANGLVSWSLLLVHARVETTSLLVGQGSSNFSRPRPHGDHEVRRRVQRHVDLTPARVETTRSRRRWRRAPRLLPARAWRPQS